MRNLTSSPLPANFSQTREVSPLPRRSFSPPLRHHLVLLSLPLLPSTSSTAKCPPLPPQTRRMKNFPPLQLPSLSLSSPPYTSSFRDGKLSYPIPRPPVRRTSQFFSLYSGPTPSLLFSWKCSQLLSLPSGILVCPEDYTPLFNRIGEKIPPPLLRSEE